MSSETFAVDLFISPDPGGCYRITGEVIKKKEKNQKKEEESVLTKDLFCGEKSVSNENHVAYPLAVYLQETIRSHSPKFKASVRQLNQWAVDLEKLMRIDGASELEIRSMIDWCHRSEEGEFWRRNILSGKKLRAQWSQLQVRKGTGQKTSRDYVVEKKIANGRVYTGPQPISVPLPKFTPREDTRSEEEKAEVKNIASELLKGFGFGGV